MVHDMRTIVHVCAYRFSLHTTRKSCLALVQTFLRGLRRPVIDLFGATHTHSVTTICEDMRSANDADPNKRQSITPTQNIHVPNETHFSYPMPAATAAWLAARVITENAGTGHRAPKYNIIRVIEI